MVFLAEIPVVREALNARRDAQTSNRERAFLGRTHDILGMKIRAMSVMDFSLLSHLKSPCPFLSRQNPSLPDLCMFLWILSVAHKRWRTLGKYLPAWIQAVHAWIHAKRCRKLRAETAAILCFEFVEEMLEDRPSTGGGSEESTMSCEAAWCHAIRGAYNCTEREVLEMPLPKLWQYLRAIKREKNPSSLECNRKTDDVANIIIAEIRAKKYTLEELKAGKAKPNLN